jgi:hypothetical protein
MNRVKETAQWFVSGFWGINASDHVHLEGIAETPGTKPFIVTRLCEASGSRSLAPYNSCPNFKSDAKDAQEKVSD